MNWQTVSWGIGLQFIFAVIVLRWPAGYTAFQWLGDRVSEFIAYTDAGAEFVLGKLYKDNFAFQASLCELKHVAYERQGRVGHGSGPSTGRVGSGTDFSLLSGLGRVGSICVGLCGSPWIIQNVTLL